MLTKERAEELMMQVDVARRRTEDIEGELHLANDPEIALEIAAAHHHLRSAYAALKARSGR